jgi:hypothetical protein
MLITSNIGIWSVDNVCFASHIKISNVVYHLSLEICWLLQKPVDFTKEDEPKD